MSLENVTTLAGQVNTDPVRYSCRMDKSPLIFDPLGNGSPVLHIDNQKVSRLNECQEAGSKGGLGMSIRTIYTYNTLTHNNLQQKKTKPTNVKRVENYSHPRKYNRVENYSHT